MKPPSRPRQFVFPLQKYLIKKESYNYFDLTVQLTREYISPALREFVAYYSNRVSYQEVEDLVERVTGEKILSDQKIWEIVVNKAVEISSLWSDEIETINSLITDEIEISATVDIYNSETQEILLFDDAIGVKKQKAHRPRRGFRARKDGARRYSRGQLSYLSSAKALRKRFTTQEKIPPNCQH